MRSLVATAPGKLVLCGEYAVLEGAPAISAAVDRRARVVVQDWSESGPESDVVVTTVGFRDGRFHYRSTDTGLEPTRQQDELPLLKAVYDSARIPTGTRLAIELDTSPFFAADVKLGLGSSAALTVALAGALAAWQGKDAAERTHFMTGMIHSRLQGGRGSGVDIATSAEGGLIIFKRQVDNENDRIETSVSSRGQLAWPGGLEVAVLFSGVAASTPARLARLDAQPRLPVSDELIEAADRAAEAWQEGEVEQVLLATARFTATLSEFSEAYDLDVFGGGHARLAELAQSQGLVYKPCGAGGGDVGIVLGDNAAGIAHFVEQATESGFVELDVRLGGSTGVKGLTVEWTHD